MTQFHRRILQRLHGHQQLVNGPPLEVRSFDEKVHACMGCEKRFASKSGYGAHMFRVHGHIHPVRRLFDTTQCGCCLRECHSYGRLKAHLFRADYCRHSLQRRHQYVTPAPGIGSVANECQERALDGLLPSLQGPGPRLPDGRHVPEIDYDLELFEAIYLGMSDVTSVTDGEALIRTLVKDRAVTWEDCRKTLQALIQEATPQDTEVLHLAASDFFALLRRLCEEAEWEFLQEDAKVVTAHWQRELSIPEGFCIEEATRHSGCADAVVIPRGFGRTRYIIHAFSGRCRYGDFQFYFDRLAHDFPDVQLAVIS